MMAELKKPNVKSKVEAVMFSTGHRINLDEISKFCRGRRDEVLAALKELQGEYDEKQSSLMLVEDGDYWRFTVRDHLIPIVRKIVTETELTRSVLETLAVIAFKYPTLQSDLIKIRTNKAYDHLVELEKSGYISRQKHGRTNLIKLTEKFFRYFDLTEGKLKEQFKDFDSIAKAIKEKEQEIEQIKEEQHRKAEELKKEDERIKKEIESLEKTDEEFGIPLEVYKAKPSGELLSEDFVREGNLILEKEKIGELEITEEGKRKVIRKEPVQETEAPIALETEVQEIQQQDAAAEPQQQTQEIREEPQTFIEKEKKPRILRRSTGIKLTPEMEVKVDEKVNEMLGIKKESKEENKEV